jgi:hypothetical protein
METMITKMYDAFNERRTDDVLAFMSSDVAWPKAFEGGYVVGHDAIRDYWSRQWSEINPNVEPVGMTERSDGRIDVDVRQVVKDMEGNMLFNGMVKHVYTVKDGLIEKMDIELVEE